MRSLLLTTVIHRHSPVQCPPVPTSTHSPVPTNLYHPPLPTATHRDPLSPTATHRYPPSPTVTHRHPPSPTVTHRYLLQELALLETTVRNCADEICRIGVQVGRARCDAVRQGRRCSARGEEVQCARGRGAASVSLKKEAVLPIAPSPRRSLTIHPANLAPKSLSPHPRLHPTHRHHSVGGR